MRAASVEHTDWSEIELLYAMLEAMQPSPVVTLNRAVAVAKVRGPAAALEMTEALVEALSGYLYYYVVRGTWLQELGRTVEARETFDNALALARTPAHAANIRGLLKKLDERDVPQARPHQSGAFPVTCGCRAPCA
jgi:RNA polymerase sigma-70 factor (ECF subfamily)